MKTLLTLITLFITLSIYSQSTTNYTVFVKGTYDEQFNTAVNTKTLYVDTTVYIDKMNNVKININGDIFNYLYVENTLKVENDKMVFHVKHQVTDEPMKAVMDKTSFALISDCGNTIIFKK
jgi:hypothetical protein